MGYGYLTVSEIARDLGVSDLHYIYYLKDAGLLPMTKIGKWRASVEDYEKFKQAIYGKDVNAILKERLGTGYSDRRRKVR